MRYSKNVYACKWKTKVAVLTLTLVLIAFSQIPLLALGLPQVDPVLASMKDSPQSGVGIRLIDATNKIRYISCTYAFMPTKSSQSMAMVGLYYSHDPQTLAWNPPNVSFSTVTSSVLAGSRFSYQVMNGKPCYLQVRKDASWFLFVFPDEVVDVAGFILRFNECFRFFETHLPKSGPAELLPSLVGELQGVR